MDKKAFYKKNGIENGGDGSVLKNFIKSNETVDTDVMQEEKVEEKREAKAEPKEEFAEPKTVKKTTGRTVSKKTKSISVSIPDEYLDLIKIAAIVSDNSVSSYLTSLVEKDLETNGKKYEEIKKLLGK